LNTDQFSKDQYMLNIENSKHYGGGKPLPILNFQSLSLQHHQVLLPLQLKTRTLRMV
jgi:hypothetical protein